jgi:ABC-type multidrug transport system ATPase subunit
MSSVALSGIAFSRASQVVLEHVTVSLEAGELVLLTGARGTGKSALLAIAAGLLRPDQGQVVIGGRNILTLQSSSLPYLRRNIGYLPAEPPFLEEETALENLMVALGVRGVDRRRAEGHARAVIEELGLSPHLARPVGQLSPAERRLCALARALCGPPPVVALDDPSVGLDDQDRARITGAVQRVLGQGSAVLCASSDPALVAALSATATRVLELSDGRILGAPAIRLVENIDSDDAIESVETTDVMPSVHIFPARQGSREAS